MARSEDAKEDQDAGNNHVIRDYHHPYTPYAIQETFMGTVYDVLEVGNVGILESPSKFD
jgi:chromosome transmission fidelity protein 1